MNEAERVLLNAGYLRGMSTREGLYKDDLEALQEACDHLIEYSRMLRIQSLTDMKSLAEGMLRK